MEAKPSPTDAGRNIILDIWPCNHVNVLNVPHVDGSELTKFESLEISHLPQPMQTDEIFAFIQKSGKRVVMIKSTKCSESRPHDDQMRQEGFKDGWTGSGFVIKQMEQIVIIATNKHVLFDEFEVQHSEVHFFYHNEEANTQASGFGPVQGLHIIALDEKHDLILAVYVLKDEQKEWLKREGFADELPLVQKTSMQPGEERKWVCLIHHPRGLPKRVSFSEIEGDLGLCHNTELHYKAATYYGSSGSPLFLFLSRPDDVSKVCHRYHVGHNKLRGTNFGKQCDITLLMQCWMSTIYNRYLNKFCRRYSEQGVDCFPLKELLAKLHEVDIIRFGEQRLSTGIDSPLDLDLRAIAWYPNLLRAVAMHIKEKAGPFLNVNAVCGVPYRGMLVSIVLAMLGAIPIILQRKEGQDSQAGAFASYHLKPGEWCSEVGEVSQTEGAEGLHAQETTPPADVAAQSSGSPQHQAVKQAGQTAKRCLVVDDVVASGNSILESVEKLRKEGLEVEHAVVFLDRDQGAKEMLQEHNITLHSVCTMLQAAQMLQEAGFIKPEEVEQIKSYVEANKIHPNLKTCKRTKMSYAARAQLEGVPSLTKKLLKIMAEKKSNVVVAVDLANPNEALALIDKVGPHVCAVKTRTDIFESHHKDFPAEIQKLATKHNFLIIEDRKYSDIGHIVATQYGGGLYKPVEWADIVTIHALPGVSIIQALEKVAKRAKKERGCLLEAEMSNDHTLAEGPYSRKALTMVAGQENFVVGFICRSNLTSDLKVLLFTAGVKMEEGKDKSGQNYLTPHEAIANRGADIIVVGRGITEDQNPAEKAKAYQRVAYDAYLERLDEDERKKETGASQQN